MRILVYSDIHFHDWVRPDGSGCEPVFDALHRVYHYANRRKVDLLVFCGDLFDHKRLWPSHIASRVYETFFMLNRNYRAQNGGACSLFVAGNHDLWKARCALDPLAQMDGCFVVRESYDFELRDHRLYFAAYGHEDAAVMSKCDLAFMHGEVQGASMGAVACEADRLDALKSQRLRYVFNGHLHNPQMLTRNGVKIVCVGSPLAHNWTALDQPNRGIVLYEDGKAKRIWFDFPRFLSSRESPHYREGDFVRSSLMDATPVEVGEQARKRQSIGALSIEKSIPAYVKHVAPVNARKALVAEGVRLYHSTEENA